MDYIEIIVITFTQQAICSNWRRHINDRLRLGDAEPISGFNKAQVSCKFYLGPTLQKLESAANSTWALQKLESAANSTWALHYKSSSQLQILPGPYTTKARVSCKFYLGPTLQKLESAANSTRALHYKVAVGMFRASTKLKSAANPARALHYNGGSGPKSAANSTRALH